MTASGEKWLGVWPVDTLVLDNQSYNRAQLLRRPNKRVGPKDRQMQRWFSRISLYPRNLIWPMALPRHRSKP